MDWKYYIPHSWESGQLTWEDVYLLPCDPNYSGQSIWLTIDALGDGSEDSLITEDYFEDLTIQMEGKDYLLQDNDTMIVRGLGFTKEEFLSWVRVWLKEKGYEADKLIEGSLEDFRGTNQHVGMIDKCASILKDLDSLPPEEREKKLHRWDKIESRFSRITEGNDE